MNRQKISSWLLVILTINGITGSCEAGSIKRGWCSWYSYESAKREGSSGMMANGRRMQDEAFTAASWDYPFGTALSICTTRNPRQCTIAIVQDRGPNLRLYRQGRILDLSKASFRTLAPLEAGVIKVEISTVKE